ncbi:WD40 repeat-like protein [Phanerochaete sordida]|uniref:WD40 repeat-like protein n=1 Tax=Phanerochaete sordida TaxID=48140 RepID=A0A9P3L9V1_9APHY|nr:WD40 repeat-like protein [Phanerochaete sordida]
MQIDGQPRLWYREPTTNSPFVLSRFACGKDAPPFTASAAFPWHMQSLDEDLFSGQLREENQDAWRAMVQTWGGSVLVGSHGCAFIVHKNGSRTHVKVPRPGQKEPDSTVRAVAWVLSSTAITEPLAVVTASKSVFIFNVTSMTIVGQLRGHGGEILSIAVHPRWPHMFLTTSRDHSTRLYDLSYKPREVPNNPPWPPSTKPSFAGTAFGLHSSEPEGNGIGRCVGVLVGGRAGGHRAAVFAAAWHPSVDIIATGGMDRTVKIWRIPQVDHEKVKEDKEHLAREDKPLFSTDLLHKSRVLGIAWLNKDTLISYAAPALMRREHVEEMYEEPGEVAVWQWFGYSRYIKEGQLRPVTRGSIVDYRNSESLRIYALYALPIQGLKVHFYISRHQHHDPMLLVPDGRVIRIFNISHFKSKQPPDFPFEQGGGSKEDDSTAQLTAKMSNVEVGDQNSEDEADEVPEVYPLPKPVPRLFDEVPGWTVDVERARELHPSMPDIDMCELAWGGKVMIGIGKNGTFWQWRLREAQV